MARRILMFTENDAWRTRLEDQLRGCVTDGGRLSIPATWESALECASRDVCDVCFLGVEDDPRAGLDRIDAIRRRAAAPPVILLVREADSALLKLYLRCGAADVLTEEEFTPFHLERALRRLDPPEGADRRERESEHYLHDVLDAVRVGIVLIDPQRHRIVEVNEYAAEVLGLPREAVIDQVCHGYLCPAESGCCPITDLGQSVDHSERALLTASGARIPVLKSVSEVWRGGCRYLVESFVDLRELKAIERQLRDQAELMDAQNQQLLAQQEQLRVNQDELLAANRELYEAKLTAETANRAKSAFLANMSHEIRTPMTAILGFTDILMEIGNIDEAPPVRLEAIQTIKRNGRYLLELVDGILDLSKIEAGKLEPEWTVCSPARLLTEVAALARVRAQAKGLTLRVEADRSLPSAVRTDSTRLKQILINLIGNAIKFTDQGEVIATARVVPAPNRRLPVCRDARPTAIRESSPAADSDRCWIQFEVIDQGIGMTAEQIKRVFRPFSQADTSMTRRYGGTGLGLAISKRLAELLEGDISVESRPGQGSVFRVLLPVECVADEDLAGDAETPARPARKPDIGDAEKLEVRVLLAEDGRDNQRLIAYYLRKIGAEVVLAENGREAVDLAAATMHPEGAIESASRFDVVLMDMQMPVMDGYEATRLLRAAGYDGPIIALTAHAMKEDRRKCLAAGCDEYATKPIDRDQLLGLIRRLSRQERGTRRSE